LTNLKTDSKKSIKGFDQEIEARWRQLLIEASEGNSTSYDVFLTEVGEYLLIYCGRYLTSPELAEDCSQNCLIALHKGKHTYQPSRPFGPWFFTIVKRKIIDQYRKNSRNKEVYNPEIVENMASSSPSFDIAEEVYKILPKMDPVYREAFKLTKLDGLSVAEASKKLGIKESALKVRVHRASKILKKLVEEDFIEKH